MKKKIFVILAMVVVFSLALTLVACGESGETVPAQPPQEEPGDNTGETGDNTGETGDNTGDNTGDKTGDDTGDDIGDSGEEEQKLYTAPVLTDVDGENVKMMLGEEVFATLFTEEELGERMADRVADALNYAGVTVEQINGILKDFEPVVNAVLEDFALDAESIKAIDVEKITAFFEDFSLTKLLEQLKGADLKGQIASLAQGTALKVLEKGTKENIILLTDACYTALDRLTAENVAKLFAVDFDLDNESGLADEETVALANGEEALALVADVVNGVKELLMYEPKELARACDTLYTLVRVADKLVAADSLTIDQIVTIVGNDLGLAKASTLQSDLQAVLQLVGKLIKTGVSGCDGEGTFDEDVAAFVNLKYGQAEEWKEIDLSGASDVAVFASDLLARLTLTDVVRLVGDVSPISDALKESDGSTIDEETSVAVGKVVVKLLQYVDYSYYQVERDYSVTCLVGEKGAALLNEWFKKLNVLDAEGKAMELGDYLDTVVYGERRIARDILSDVRGGQGKTKSQVIAEIKANEEELKKYFTDEELKKIGDFVFARGTEIFGKVSEYIAPYIPAGQE